MKIVIYQALILQIIVMLNDVDSLYIKIERNVSGILGQNGTEIECSYTRDNVREINRVDIWAFNRSSVAFEQVAVYLPDDISTLLPEGRYLKGRVTLTSITQSSTKAVMIFNKLMCIDDTFYRCRVKYTDSNVVDRKVFSSNMTIQVQVKPLKPDRIVWMKVSTDSPSTILTVPMSSSTLSSTTEVTKKEHEIISTFNGDEQNDTIASTYSTFPATNRITSNPIGQDLFTDSNLRTSTYSIQYTATEQGLAEGDNITVVCTGDVGNPPAEYFFQKYRSDHILSMTYTATETSISEISENCSFYRTSNLTFQVKARDNNAVIRCVVNSSMEEPTMYVDMEPLEVYSADKTTPSTSGSWLNKAKDNGTVIAIAIVVVLIVIGVVVLLIVLRYRRIRTKEEYKPADRIELNMDQIETTQIVPSTSFTKKTTGYEDIDLDDTDMKFKLLSDEETIAQVKQHNDEYWKKLKEDEEREKDNPTQPPEAAVYACVNKPKSTVTTENKPPAGQEEEDVYEESKEGLYDTSGERRHKENITVEKYDSTENRKNEEGDHNDLFSEQNSQIGAYINNLYGSTENKDEKRQVATVSPTVRLSSSSQGDGQKHKSDEIQPKTVKLTTHETSL